LKEDFQYDNLDRLDNVYMDTIMTLDMDYESLKGGITIKSDVGTLIYDTPGKPYALGHIVPSTGLTPGSEQSFSYTSFESVSTITENGYSASFLYNSDNERAKMIVQQDANTILTRWNPIASYIKETAGSVTKEFTFIGGNAYTAPVVAIIQSGTTTYYNLLRDYLGNITHVVDAGNNSAIAEYSFDAWGRMRDPASWENYNPGSEPVLFVAGRGFTGHEHLPWFNLINMNGRVYDPLIGMFLSPDNYVQNPDLTQNFNRYGYCLNNPLSFSDPGGFLMTPTSSNYNDNPEGGAWLANYYYEHGGGGGGPSWVNSFLDYSHTCFENGGEVSVSDFDNKVNTSSNGSITIQTGIIDYYTFTSTDGGETWHKGNYINSKPIYSTIPSASGFWDPSLNTNKFDQSISLGGLMFNAGKGISQSQINSSIKALQNSGKASLPYFSKAGRFLGWVNVLPDAIELMGNQTWGNGVKVGLNIATIYVPYAGWAYGLVDIGFSAFSNASLTDRIGSGIDRYLNKAGGVMMPWNGGYIWISNYRRK
jgi:RHS repeat-associated protein